MIYPLRDRVPQATVVAARRVGACRPSAGNCTRYHAGTDRPASPGDVIIAPFSGKASTSGWVPGRRSLFLRSGAMTMVIAPVEDFTGTKNVQAGEAIALADPYGKSPHVHIEWHDSDVSPGTRYQRVLAAGKNRPLGLLDEPQYQKKKDDQMSATAYAYAVAILSRWTAGAATEEEATEQWSKLTADGKTDGAAPSKTGWPKQLRHPETDQPWTWAQLLVAVSPAGALWKALVAPEEFKAAVSANVKAGAAAAAQGAKAIGGAALSGLAPILVGGALVGGALLYFRSRRR